MRDFIYERDYTAKPEGTGKTGNKNKTWDVEKLREKIQRYTERLQPKGKSINWLAQNHFITLTEELDRTAEEEGGKIRSVIDCQNGVAKITTELPSFDLGYFSDPRLLLFNIILYADNASFSAADGGWIKLEVSMNYFVEPKSMLNKEQIEYELVRSIRLPQLLEVLYMLRNGGPDAPIEVIYGDVSTTDE